MADDIKVTISGDSKPLQDELKKVEQSTSTLEQSLSALSKISAVAFSGLVAGITLSVKAYAESEASTKRLTQALQNQGIYSKELADSYAKQAKELSVLTGIDDDAIVAGQALFQGMVGQIKVTKEMSAAALDLATFMGTDASGGFEALGRAMNGNLIMLKKMGIQIDENLPLHEKQKQILEKIAQVHGGLAESANQGLGSVKGLSLAFGDFQKEIGRQFAPIITEAIKAMTTLMRTISENQPLMDMIVHIMKIGVVVTGAITAFAALTKGLAIAEYAMTALGLSVRGLIGATGIGLLLIIASEIYLNWSTIWPRLQAVFSAFANNISDLAGGLGKILIGALVLQDMKAIEEGWNQVKAAVAKGMEEATKEIKPLPAPEQQGPAQDETKKENADKAAAERQRQADLEAQIDAESKALALAKLQEFDDQEIAMKEEHLALLKAQKETHDAALIQAEKGRANDVLVWEEEQHAANLERQQIYHDEQLKTQDDFNALSTEQQTLYNEQEKKQLVASIKTKNDIRKDELKRKQTEDIQNRNQYLADEAQFGTAMATMKEVQRSKEYQGTKQGFNELQQLQTSNNATLKGIGKVAAIANIVIKTAESAMAIYAGFSTIPIVGPALGIAGAAAAVAFGAEQVSKVNSAADGGLITGGRAGFDSVPAMLMPGELVVPTRNFNDVIDAVTNQKLMDEGRAPEGGSSSMVMIGFDGQEAEQVLTARQTEARNLGTFRGEV